MVCLVISFFLETLPKPPSFCEQSPLQREGQGAITPKTTRNCHQTTWLQLWWFWNHLWREKNAGTLSLSIALIFFGVFFSPKTKSIKPLAVYSQGRTHFWGCYLAWQSNKAVLLAWPKILSLIGASVQKLGAQFILSIVARVILHIPVSSFAQSSPKLCPDCGYKSLMDQDPPLPDPCFPLAHSLPTTLAPWYSANTPNRI